MCCRHCRCCIRFNWISARGKVRGSCLRLLESVRAHKANKTHASGIRAPIEWLCRCGSRPARGEEVEERVALNSWLLCDIQLRIMTRQPSERESIWHRARAHTHARQLQFNGRAEEENGVASLEPRVNEILTKQFYGRLAHCVRSCRALAARRTGTTTTTRSMAFQ